MDYPQELHDDRYCPDCKKVILTALQTVPPKFEKVIVDTDEIDYPTLKDSQKDHSTGMLPLCRLVFAELSRQLTPGHYEHTVTEAFIIEKNYRKIKYYTHYWPSELPKVQIRVAKEKNVLTGEITNYWEE
jgi:hypothetical protein